MADDDDLIPDSGAVFTFGRSRFADNIANKFWIKNDPVLHISCGDEHSAVLTDRGRVYVFGSNEWGQLGLGHVKPLNKPSFVKALKPEKITLLACGRSHTLLYSESEKLFSFGSNGDGQLGHGDKQDQHFPKEITALSGVSLKSISCGAYHSAVLTKKGEVYVWGVNSDGQIGLGEIEECSIPTKLTLEHDIISLSCGYYHSALVTKNGLLLTFGEDENGKLGLSESQCDDTTIPQSVAKLEEDKYTDVSCGARHTVAITEKGCCYSWGDGSHGQLGHGTMMLEVPLPKQIDLLRYLKIVYVSCGDGQTAIVTDSGKIYTFGDGRHGKLGQGDECFSNLFKPTVISRFDGFNVKFVACGGCHMLIGAIRKDEENTDVVDGEKDTEEDDILNASMRSNKSIPEANMTLKPGSITYPLVTPRDKRRHKKDDVLNNSLNLNSSLNSSLNMAQLSRTTVQLPTVLDRSRLPKIPGVNQISINNYDRKEYSKIVEEDEGKKKGTFVTEKLPDKECKDVVEKKEEPVEATNSKKEKSKDSEEDLGKDEVTPVPKNTVKNAPLRKSKKVLNSEDEEDDDEDEDEEEEVEKKKKRKGKDIPVQKKKVKDSPAKKSKKVLESENEEDDEEEDDEDDSEEEIQEKGKNKQKGKNVPAPKEKKAIQKKSKKMEDSGNEDEYDDEDDEDDDDVESEEETAAVKKKKGKVLKVQKNKGKGTPQKKSKKVVESEDEDEDEEDIDDEEDEEDEDSYEEEEDSPEVKKKGKKTDNTVLKKGKEISKSKKNNSVKEETEKSRGNKSSQKKTPEKKVPGKKAKEKEEEEDEDDEDDEEEEDDEDEDDEEEEDEEEEEDDDEEVDDKEQVDGKTGKGKKAKKVKSDETDKETNAEETKPEATNRSGFLNFFRRNKKPQVDVAPSGSKSPETTPSPTEGTNKNQSKTCTIL